MTNKLNGVGVWNDPVWNTIDEAAKTAVGPIRVPQKVFQIGRDESRGGDRRTTCPSKYNRATLREVAPDSSTDLIVPSGVSRQGREDRAVTRRIHFRLAVMTAFCVMALAVEAAAAPTLINVCRTIDKPGSYVLSKNLTAPGDCLVVAADFITIDLNGFVVSGTGTATGVTLKARNSYRGTVIRNGTITGFAIGINLNLNQFSVDAAVIERMRVFLNRGQGIIVGGNSSVTGCVVSGNGSDGIVTGVDSLVTGNIVAKSGGRGIIANGGSIVRDNTVSSSGGDGIGTNTGGLVSGNVADSNNGAGIHVVDWSAVLGNTVIGNGSGIVAAVGNTVTANTVVQGSQGGVGISINCPSTVLANTATGGSQNLVTTGAGCTVAQNTAP